MGSLYDHRVDDSDDGCYSAAKGFINAKKNNTLYAGRGRCVRQSMSFTGILWE
jgi:hypothetical protein